jgi:NhaP-type Na+/H+ or K+/H+ antiporter
MVLLAAPGVLISASIVALVLDLATGLPFELGMVVGDGRGNGSRGRDRHVQDLGARAAGHAGRGRGLFNDGTALVLFVVTVNAISGE